jgi:hypothetical protein
MTTHASSSDLPAKTTRRRLPSLWVVLVALGVIGLALVCGVALVQEGMDTAMMIGVIFTLLYSLVAGGVWFAYRLVRDLHRLGKLRMFFGVGIPFFLVAAVGYALWRANAEQSMVINRGDLVGGLAFALASWYAFGRFLKR